ncbi:hypothetical protein ACE6H2_027385 [Prunus campanulata]
MPTILQSCAGELEMMEFVIDGNLAIHSKEEGQDWKQEYYFGFTIEESLEDTTWLSPNLQ